MVAGMDNGTIGAWAGVVVAILGIFVGTLTGCGEPFKAPLFDDETGGGGSDSGVATGSTSTGSTVTDPGAGGAGGSGPVTTCEHSTCGAGEALDPECDPCVAKVCADYPDLGCCTIGWTVACAVATQHSCDSAPCGMTGTCDHSICEVGGPLQAADSGTACNVCAWRVCQPSQRPSCCTDEWDSTCVALVDAQGCGVTCM